MAEHFELSRATQIEAQEFNAEEECPSHCDSISVANVITRMPGGSVFVSKCHPMSRFPIDIMFSRRVAYQELRIIQKVSELVESNRCPNFVRHYHAYVAPCRLKTMLNKPTPQHALYTINEYCDGGDLEHWQMTGAPHSPEEWQSMMGQFLLAHTALSALEVVHRDMHWGNLLMKKTTPGGYWWYIIVNGGRSSSKDSERYDFFVPNTGQQWKIWDFGQSIVLPKIDRSAAIWEYVLSRAQHDIENIIMGVWDFAHSVNQKPVIRGECGHSMEDLFSDELRLAPALEILRELDWFQDRPEGRCLNANPYIIDLV